VVNHGGESNQPPCKLIELKAKTMAFSLCRFVVAVVDSWKNEKNFQELHNEINNNKYGREKKIGRTTPTARLDPMLFSQNF